MDLNLKLLDFDKSSDEFAQFAVAFPKYGRGHNNFSIFYNQQTREQLRGLYKVLH